MGPVPDGARSGGRLPTPARAPAPAATDRRDRTPSPLGPPIRDLK